MIERSWLWTLDSFCINLIKTWNGKMKQTLSIEFNKICLNEFLLLKYASSVLWLSFGSEEDFALQFIDGSVGGSTNKVWIFQSQDHWEHCKLVVVITGVVFFGPWHRTFCDPWHRTSLKFTVAPCIVARQREWSAARNFSSYGFILHQWKLALSKSLYIFLGRPWCSDVSCCIKALRTWSLLECVLFYADHVPNPSGFCVDEHWFDAGRGCNIQNFKVDYVMLQ